MDFFSHSPFSTDSSFPSHDHDRISSSGGSVMKRVSFSETLRASNAVELLQREHEKERIREESIAAERIMEVRSELATERELTRLQQTKPAPSLATIDGKVVGVGGASFPWKELTCDLCQVRVRSEIDLRAHNSGKKHKEKLEAAAPKANAVSVASKGGSNLISKVGAVDGDGSHSNSKKKAYKEWTCHICNVSMSCDQGLFDHINGKKHKARRQHRDQMKLQVVQGH